MELIGSAHAHHLITILSDAEAVETAAELIDLYNPDVVLDGHFISIPIGPHHRLSLVAIGAKFGRDDAAPVDWGRVNRLKVVDIS